MIKSIVSRKNDPGFTIIELVITLVIVGLLAAATVITLAGILPGYNLSKGAREIFNTMLMARSKSVSINRNYRLNILSTKQYKLQYYNGTTWVDDGGVVTLPTDIEIPTSPFNYRTNAGTNLEFTSRGILNVLNGAQTNPYIAVKNIRTNQQKTITVNIGGNFKIN